MSFDPLDKRRREYRRIGWVYMLKNSAFKKPLLKIGRTARSPMERAHELGTATGVPEGFELVYFVHVSNRNDAERDVHHALDRYRQSHKKEFFEVSLRTAIQSSRSCGRHLPHRSGPRFTELGVAAVLSAAPCPLPILREDESR